MIFEYRRDVHRLPALLLCQTFFASKPMEGFRIDHSHVVLSFCFTLAPSFEHRQNLVCVSPDFLSRLLALAKFMRLSLLKAAQAVVFSAACRKSGFLTKQHVKLHGLAVGIGCKVKAVTGEHCSRAPK
jgi:hypothetical protein